MPEVRHGDIVENGNWFIHTTDNILVDRTPEKGFDLEECLEIIPQIINRVPSYPYHTLVSVGRSDRLYVEVGTDCGKTTVRLPRVHPNTPNAVEVKEGFRRSSYYAQTNRPADIVRFNDVYESVGPQPPNTSW